MRVKRVHATGLFGYGDEILLRNLESPTVIIGKNNCGKSNILKIIQIAKRVLAGQLDVGNWSFLDHERYQDTEQRSATNSQMSITFALTEVDRQHLPPHLNFLRLNGPSNDDRWQSVANDVTLTLPVGRSRATLAPTGKTAFIESDIAANASIHNFLAPHIQQRLISLQAFRRDSDPRSTGGTIIQQMHAWCAPASTERHLRRRFDAVQKTFCNLADLPDAQLVPQSDGKAMQVSWRGRYLPLDSFGDGFRHLLIIAFELEANPGAVFLLEEPETHLHPGIQRRLLALCRERQDAQFIMTTHAPAILDSIQSGSVFRISHDGEKSRVNECKTRDTAFLTLDDLGVRPSDLFQTNVAIWVEGPSDRLFLRKCLELAAPDLREGLHYQIVFYGGRLRSHLTAGGEYPFVDVLNLCRNVAMIADSDKVSDSSKIDDSKTRLQKEVIGAHGHYWITDGREIENYFPPVAVKKTLDALLKASIEFQPPGLFERFSDAIRTSLASTDSAPAWLCDYDSHKVRFVSELVKYILVDNFTEPFSSRLLQLAIFIRKSQLDTPKSSE